MWYAIDKFFNFLNNSSWIVTLLVGLSVFVLYKIQQRDKKHSIAVVILQEIRKAEERIDELKENGIKISSNMDLLLPNNSWIQYHHLFVNIFNSDELNLVNNFYEKCQAIDSFLIEICFSKQLEQKAVCVQQTLAQIAKEICLEYKNTIQDPGNLTLLIQEYTKRQNIFIALFEQNSPHVFSPKEPFDNTIRLLASVDKILIGNVGNKLRQIAKIK